MTAVLFVCLANVCRSPMALAVAQQLRPAPPRRPLRRLFGRLFGQDPQRHEAGADTIVFDAAGLHVGGWGERPDSRAVACLARRGYAATQRRSRRLHADDFERHDLLLAMDQAVLDELLLRCPPQQRHKLQLMLDQVEGCEGQDIPDPYHGNVEGFERSLDLCERAVRALIDRLNAAQASTGAATAAVPDPAER